MQTKKKKYSSVDILKSVSALIQINTSNLFGENIMPYLIGVDVGTQSVRACLVDIKGKVLKTSIHGIKIYQPKEDFYEQSSEEIWDACCKSVKEVIKYEASEVIGIGFTATCSLVALDENFQPISISPSGNTDQNVIMWMDHRAVEETKIINGTNHPVLKFVGGSISVEMQPPKLLWLKKNLPKMWEHGGYYMDLPDFLTWKATGSTTRSLCSLTCKWMYQSRPSKGISGWDDTFWEEIGLNDLKGKNYEKIGKEVNLPGTPCGEGLTDKAAEQMGAKPRTPVGTSMIDAYAGGLGMFSCTLNLEKDNSVHSKLGMICGTSSCHLTMSEQPVFTPGVWGPYYSVLLPGYWTNEGGQSVTGKLLDHIIFNHPAYPALSSRVGMNRVYDELDNILHQQQIKLNLPHVAELTNLLHIFPDFHGNRSPLADPTLKGMVSGLTLITDEVDLAKQYLSAIQALAYETRYIISVMETAGHSFTNIIICGGLSYNYTFVQTLADVTGLTVIQPEESESVLLGAAILGAIASGHFQDIHEVLKSMGGVGKIYKPKTVDKMYHHKKYKVFLKMLEHQQEYKSIMSEIGS